MTINIQMSSRLGHFSGAGNYSGRQTLFWWRNRLVIRHSGDQVWIDLDDMRRSTPSKSAGRRGAGVGPAPQLNRDIQSEIGQALREMYDDVVKEGVPDRFSRLLAQLDKPENGHGKPPSE